MTKKLTVAIATLVLTGLFFVGKFWLRPRSAPEPARKNPPTLQTAMVKSAMVAARARSSRDAQRATEIRRSEKGNQFLQSLLISVVASKRPELQLSAAELETLMKDFVEFENLTAEITAAHVRDVAFDGRTLKLRVEPFLEEGKALRELFNEQLKADFPNGRYEAIDDRLGEFFDTHFKGFGVMDQTFELTRNADNDDWINLQWSGKIGPDLTPSRLLPERNAGRWTGSTSSGWLTLESTETGEFTFLHDLLAAHLADGNWMKK